MPRGDWAPEHLDAWLALIETPGLGRAVARRLLRLYGDPLALVHGGRPDLDAGRSGRQRYRWIEERFSDPDEFKIVALHHHLLPVPGTGRERNIVYDAGDLLRVLSANGCDVVLCGHKHVPHVWRLEDMIVVNAGTACSHRLRGMTRASYNIIEITGDRVRVILKHPFGEPETVADFERDLRRECVWKPSANSDAVHADEAAAPAESRECR